MVKHPARWPRFTKVHTCNKCGADVEMWIKPGTNWQCQCYAWNIFNPIATDQKTVAERQWQGRTLAPKPQKACDIGLFSDDANQLDLIEMFMEPTND